VNTEVVLAILGVLATLVGGLIWVVKYLANTLTRELKQLVKLGTNQLAEAKKGNKESRVRNGNLSELIVAENAKVREAVQNIKQQHVSQQVVGEEIVHKKVEKK